MAGIQYVCECHRLDECYILPILLTRRFQIVPNREGRVGSAVKVFALGKKRTRKLRIGEKGFPGWTRCRNDLGDKAARFGNKTSPVDASGPSAWCFREVREW